MEEFEKVEELVRATGVSYEDAKNAIRACEGNIVDAVSYLEKLGKFDPKAEKRTAPNYEEKCRKAFIEAKKPAGKFVDFLTKNKLDIKKGDDTVASVPVGAAAALCLISATVTLSAAFVSMMCGCDYSFKGENNLDTANKVMDKVGETANVVKDKFSEAAAKIKEELENKNESDATGNAEEEISDVNDNL